MNEREVVPADLAPAGAAPEDQIGVRIAQKRLAKGLNHDGLAKLTKLFDPPANAGISRTTIRGYEVGLYKPGTRELRLLSQALEVTPTWLIFGDPPGAISDAAAPEQAQGLPHTELQKFVVAMHLLRAVEAADRDVVYGVLHAIARHKLGENVYRAGVIPYAEMGALLADVWADLKEGGSFDQAKIEELVKAHGPLIDSLVEKDLGMKLSDLRKRV